jgi:branched-subunit amino acid ABC-type transport system permease component
VSTFLQMLFSGLSSGSIYALAAVGFTFLFSTGRYLNFGHGDWAMFSGMAAAAIVTARASIFVGALAAPLTGAVIAMTTYYFLLRRARSRDPLTIALLLLALGLVLEGIAVLAWGSQPIGISILATYPPIRIYGAVITAIVIVILTTTIVVLAAVTVLIRYTRLGRSMVAWAENPEAAALSGINVHRVLLIAFGLAGALAGIAGFLTLALTGLSFQSGILVTTKAFGAAAVGGFTSPQRAVIGGLVIGLVEAAVGTYVGGDLSPVASLLLIFVLVLVAGQLRGDQAETRESDLLIDKTNL